MVRERICSSPMDLRHDKRDTLPVTCLPAEEVDATEGSKPIVCRLLDNPPVQSLDDALELIEWYRAPWEVELLFLILKEAAGLRPFCWAISNASKRRWRRTW